MNAQPLMPARIAPTDEILKSYALNESKDTVRVCAWCFPFDTILQRFPHLRGKVAVSHGICRDHSDAIRAKILL